LRVFTLNTTGRRFEYAIFMESANGPQSSTAVISEVALLFTPMPKSARVYTYYVRCWEKAEGRIKDVLWTENPQLVSAWLESIANTVVTVERPGMTSYTGKVDNVEYLEAAPSRRANGREGLYEVSIRWLA
jgi:hypothetical protein